MRLNQNILMKKCKLGKFVVQYGNRGVRYLGLNFSSDLSVIVQNNFTSLINMTKNVLAHWSKLKLRWIGRISAIKKILLKVYFFRIWSPLSLKHGC